MSFDRLRPLLLIATVLIASPAAAQVSATDAWVRAMVPGQDTAAVYMRLSAASDATLVGGSSSVAKRVEVHEMAMEGGVMKMRHVPRLKLAAGKSVELKPNGFHVMLVEVNRTLREGEKVPVTLEVEDAAGRKSTVAIEATVEPVTARAAPHSH